MKDLICDLKTDGNAKYCMMVRYPETVVRLILSGLRDGVVHVPTQFV